VDLEVLKKKISTYRGEGGRVRITDDALLLEILLAWEQWPGPMKGFYSAIGVSAKGMASVIGKAKKLRREGYFPIESFKEIKIEPVAPVGDYTGGLCRIELAWNGHQVIRFGLVEQLIEFLKATGGFIDSSSKKAA
jgi:hypothetical protein